MGHVVGPGPSIEVPHPVLSLWIIEPSRRRRMARFRQRRTIARSLVRFENRHHMPPGVRLCTTS